MPVFDSSSSRFRVLVFSLSCLFISLFAFAQVNLTHHLLSGYLLNEGVHVNKGKPTLFVCEESDAFGEVFKAATNGKRADAINFSRESVIGILLPPTNKPPKLSVSKVFVQDSMLTIRYIRIADTTLTSNPLPSPSQPLLLLKVPKQTVLKTKLVENGKVVQIIKKGKED